MTLPGTHSHPLLTVRSLRHASLALLLPLAALPATAQNQLWIQQFGTSKHEEVQDSAPMGASGVYLVGKTYGSLAGTNAGGTDAWLARYDGAGNQVWVRQLGTSAAEWGEAAAPDGAGGVYFGGWTGGALGGAAAGFGDAWLARYDQTGNQLWIRQLGTAGDEGILAAASDGSGGVYVTGRTTGSLGGQYLSGSDVWLARYDDAGNQLWIRQFGTPIVFQAFFESPDAAVPDGSGGVYLSGWTTGPLAGPHKGGEDTWVARYDGAGNQLWILQLGTSVSHDRGWLAAPDGSGGLFVGGYTEGSLGGTGFGLADGWIARYDGGGSQLWIRQLGTKSPNLFLAGAPDGSGGVHVVGTTFDLFSGGPGPGAEVWMGGYDAAGNPRCFRTIGTGQLDEGLIASSDGAGGVYFGGVTGGALGGSYLGGHDIWLARYDAECEPCGTFSTYCTAKTNSAGCLPAIAAGGTPSASAGSGFTISTTSVLDNKFGIYFYGNSGAKSAPFQGGVLCVKPPTKRTPPQSSGGSGPCGGSFQLDFNAFAASGADLTLHAGQKLWLQAWSRDPGFAPPNNSSLSDAITFTLCP
jgi:hypothetical protein